MDPILIWGFDLSLIYTSIAFVVYILKCELPQVCCIEEADIKITIVYTKKESNGKMANENNAETFKVHMSKMFPYLYFSNSN